MATMAQQDIYKYIRQRFDMNTIDNIIEVDQDSIRVIFTGGTERELSVNLYSDILENGKVIAVSDLEHDLLKLKLDDRPESWTDK